VLAPRLVSRSWLLYQLALSFGGVTEYILEHPRTNVLHANKEGLCSWIGYLAIYLIGAQCGSWLLQPQRSTTQSRWQALQWTAVATLLCWLLTFLVAQFVQAPSRRMANAAYVLITLATNLQTLLLCAVASFVTPPVPLPLIDAVNANQLLVFLAANLLTGAVNLTIRAREQSNTVALTVLSGYLGVVCAVALALARLGWKLRI
jgi:phosphatidylinositol glycan class W